MFSSSAIMRSAALLTRRTVTTTATRSLFATRSVSTTTALTSTTNIARNSSKNFGFSRVAAAAALTATAGAALFASSAVLAAAAEEVNPNKPDMPMRMLGNTGLQVSVLSYGFWATFGSKSDLHAQAGIERAKDCLRVARKAGINLFDNAETYGTPCGAAELIMGEAIRQLRIEEPELWRRTDILITTKIFWGGPGVNERGLSRKHINEGVTAANQRLQVDYVDLVFCHRPDPLTPTATVVRAMSEVVRSGKATAWGTSEWSAQQITEAFYIAKEEGLEPPQFEQPQYNMYHRDRFEQEYHPLYKGQYGMGTTIWSPLASGFLTGKYNDSVPDGSRATAAGYEWLLPKLKEWHASGKIAQVRQLTAMAESRYQCSMSQLALAWCLHNKNVSTVLLGATKPEQLIENLGALRVARLITEEDMAAIDAILGNKPPQYQGYGGAGMRSIDTL